MVVRDSGLKSPKVKVEAWFRQSGLHQRGAAREQRSNRQEDRFVVGIDILA